MAGALIFLLSSWTASAAAQPPDSATVVAPLLSHAHGDLAEGRTALAAARAEAVLRVAPADSPQAAQARAIRARAEGSAAADAPSPDVVYEPLILQAETDGAEGNTNLARARVQVVIDALPEVSPLATRARNLASILAGAPDAGDGDEAIPPPPGSGVPPPPSGGWSEPPPPGTPATAATPPPDRSVAPGSVDEEADDRREISELIEGYVAAFGVGVIAGIATLALADVEEAFWYVSVPMLSGTAMIVPVLVLDTVVGPMRSGIPSAISIGSAIGLGNGLLAWGAIEASLSAKGVLGLIGATSVGGALLGGLWGYGLQLTPAENRLVGALAGWAAFTGLFAGLSFEEASDEAPFQIGLAAGNTAMALGLLIGAVADVSLEKVVLASGAPLAGILVGLMVAGIIHAKADTDGTTASVRVTTGALSIGAGSGLALGLILMALDDSEREREETDLDDESERAERGTEIDLDASPEPEARFDILPAAVPGGGMVTAVGTF